MTYKKMWEELKQYIEKYENENEIAYVMQQIEERYFKTDEEDLLKEMSK